jgi:hypothetical protein
MTELIRSAGACLRLFLPLSIFLDVVCTHSSAQQSQGALGTKSLYLDDAPRQRCCGNFFIIPSPFLMQKDKATLMSLAKHMNAMTMNAASQPVMLHGVPAALGKHTVYADDGSAAEVAPVDTLHGPTEHAGSADSAAEEAAAVPAQEAAREDVVACLCRQGTAMPPR